MPSKDSIEEQDAPERSTRQMLYNLTKRGAALQERLDEIQRKLYNLTKRGAALQERLDEIQRKLDRVNEILEEFS